MNIDEENIYSIYRIYIYNMHDIHNNPILHSSVYEASEYTINTSLLVFIFVIKKEAYYIK